MCLSCRPDHPRPAFVLGTWRSSPAVNSADRPQARMIPSSLDGSCRRSTLGGRSAADFGSPGAVRLLSQSECPRLAGRRPSGWEPGFEGSCRSRGVGFRPTRRSDTGAEISAHLKPAFCMSYGGRSSITEDHAQGFRCRYCLSS